MLKRRGQIFVISAPSGAGKSSLVTALSDMDKNIALSVSHTSRAIRDGEQDGVNYHFVSTDVFEYMLKQKDFLEHARVYDNYYGTSISMIKECINSGKDIILEIDWQGARQVKDIFNDARTIFILPPSYEELERRLRNRNTDSEEIINKRLALSKEDISHVIEFDYAIINDDFTHALRDLHSIIIAGRNKVSSNIKKYQQLFNIYSSPHFFMLKNK